MATLDQAQPLDRLVSVKLGALGEKLHVAPERLASMTVAEFFQRLYAQTDEQRDLAAIAAALPAARKADPDHARAIKDIVSAELAAAGKDSIEGDLISTTSTPLQRSLEAVLHG